MVRIRTITIRYPCLRTCTAVSGLHTDILATKLYPSQRPLESLECSPVLPQLGILPDEGMREYSKRGRREAKRGQGEHPIMTLAEGLLCKDESGW